LGHASNPWEKWRVFAFIFTAYFLLASQILMCTFVDKSLNIAVEQYVFEVKTKKRKMKGKILSSGGMRKRIVSSPCEEHKRCTSQDPLTARGVVLVTLGLEFQNMCTPWHIPPYLLRYRRAFKTIHYKRRTT
jgi:hypothetical protein